MIDFTNKDYEKFQTKAQKLSIEDLKNSIKETEKMLKNNIGNRLLETEWFAYKDELDLRKF